MDPMEPPTHTLLGQMPGQFRGSMHSEKIHKSSDHRRSNKPIMEKRRRARINNCLGELKGLILDAMKKDPARHSKLEKADILEMTVKHLQNMQRQQLAIAVATDPSVMTKFRTGFGECATEVARYVARIDGVDPAVRQRLLGHLRSCLSGLNQLSPAAFACLVPSLAPNTSNTPASFLQSPFQQQSSMPPFGHFPFSGMAGAAEGLGSGSRMVGGLHLFPSRLPNGDIAFVLPNHQQTPSTVGDYPAASTVPSSGPPSPGPASALPSPSSSPSPPPTAAPVAAPHLPPAFPTNPPMVVVTAAISSSTGQHSSATERRTPSAFTSVLNAGSASLPPAAPLSTSAAALMGGRAASPSPNSSACTVSSTTSSGTIHSGSKSAGSPPPMFDLDMEVATTIPLAIKRESGETWPLMPSSTTAQQQQQLLVSPQGVAATTHRQASKSRRSKLGEESAVKSESSSSGILSTATTTSSTNNNNQMEAYDLSRPSTSGVCSMAENDVMWRPW